MFINLYAIHYGAAGETARKRALTSWNVGKVSWWVLASTYSSGPVRSGPVAQAQTHCEVVDTAPSGGGNRHSMDLPGTQKMSVQPSPGKLGLCKDFLQIAAKCTFRCLRIWCGIVVPGLAWPAPTMDSWQEQQEGSRQVQSRLVGLPVRTNYEIIEIIKRNECRQVKSRVPKANG